MAAKSTRAPARRKSVSNPKVVANIIHLSVERRKESALEKWGRALQVYLSSLGSVDISQG